MKAQSFAVSLILSAAVLLPSFLHAHGAHHEVIKNGAIGVKISLHSGAPWRDARVKIFAPGETATHFETVSDPRGMITFFPHKPGTWILQVRGKDGHAMRINLKVDDKMIPVVTPPEGVFTGGQKALMALAIVWGLIGTALFFNRRKS